MFWVMVGEPRIVKKSESEEEPNRIPDTATHAQAESARRDTLLLSWIIIGLESGHGEVPTTGANPWMVAPVQLADVE